MFEFFSGIATNYLNLLNNLLTKVTDKTIGFRTTFSDIHLKKYISLLFPWFNLSL